MGTLHSFSFLRGFHRTAAMCVVGLALVIATGAEGWADPRLTDTIARSGPDGTATLNSCRRATIEGSSGWRCNMHRADSSDIPVFVAQRTQPSRNVQVNRIPAGTVIRSVSDMEFALDEVSNPTSSPTVPTPVTPAPVAAQIPSAPSVADRQQPLFNQIADDTAAAQQTATTPVVRTAEAVPLPPVTQTTAPRATPPTRIDFNDPNLVAANTSSTPERTAAAPSNTNPDGSINFSSPDMQRANGNRVTSSTSASATSTTSASASTSSDARTSHDIRNARNAVREEGSSDEECSTVAGLGLHSCKSTRRIIQGMQGTTQGLDQMSATALQARGQGIMTNLNQSQMDNGGISVGDNYRAQADVLTAQERSQYVSSAVNLMAGVTTLSRIGVHGEDASNVSRSLTNLQSAQSSITATSTPPSATPGAPPSTVVTGSSNELMGNFMQTAGLNGQYAMTEEQTRNEIARQAQATGRSAAREISDVKTEATMASMQHMMLSAAQMAQARMARSQANTLRDQARKMDKIQDNLETTTIGSEDANPIDSSDNSAPDSIAPGATQQLAEEDSSTTSDEPASLGDPTALGPSGGDIAQNAPPAGAFQDKAGGATAGGGGSPGGTASASASPSTAAATEDTAAKSFNPRGRAGLNYAAGGGGGTRYGAGGGSRGPASGGMGPDLNKMMEALMGKNGAGGPDARNQGILDFAAANARNGQQQLSLLDRNTDIFGRIHETYQDKVKRGIVGGR